MPDKTDRKERLMSDREPRLVGLWCADCDGLRTPEGTRIGVKGGAQCGVDYGEGMNSHLNVVPLYVTPASFKQVQRQDDHGTVPLGPERTT